MSRSMVAAFILLAVAAISVALFATEIALFGMCPNGIGLLAALGLVIGVPGGLICWVHGRANNRKPPIELNIR